MTRDDIIRLAHEAGLHLATEHHWMPIIDLSYAEKFARLVAAAERTACSQWMMARGFSTGHGDSVADLLTELEWQIRERELKACAQLLIRQMAGLRMEAEQRDGNERRIT